MTAEKCGRCGDRVTHTAVYGSIVERLCEKDATALQKKHGKRKVAVRTLTHTKEMQP